MKTHFKTIRGISTFLTIVALVSSFASTENLPNKNIPIVKKKVVVIGSGPSGCMAATYLGRSMLEPLIVAGFNAGGQLMLTSDVENFPGHHGTTGPALMKSLLDQVRLPRRNLLSRDFT